jgi:hypothetical protein
VRAVGIQERLSSALLEPLTQFAEDRGVRRIVLTNGLRWATYVRTGSGSFDLTEKIEFRSFIGVSWPDRGAWVVERSGLFESTLYRERLLLAEKP